MILLGLGGWIAIAVVAVLVILIVIWGVSTYNKLVKGRNKVKNQFSQIDVQLKRRFDLIPNLVETVKGYATHEKDILEKFAQARTMYQTARADGDVEKMAKANSFFGGGINALVNAVKEQYPQLQANQNFQNLMKELKETEDKIAYQRQFYNDVVLSYNNSRELFPSSIIAGMFNFKEEKFFETDEASRENVQVKF